MIQEEEDQGQFSSHQSQAINNFETYQDQFLLQQQQQQQQQNSDIFMFPSAGEVSPVMQPWSMPVPVNNPYYNHDPFVMMPSSHHHHHQASPYASFFNRRVVPNNSLHHQFAYDHGCSHDQQHLRRIISSSSEHGCSPFELQAELGKMSAQEIMEAKAIAASKSHSEAERRRRERINNHLAKLRSLLPNTTKTDKASLLAEVIQHVKELKRQTSLIAETSPVPTESDELTVDAADEDGKFVIKASLCCDDRSDLLPELIKTLKALRLRTLKADITTLGGRVKNVLFITGEEDSSTSSGDQEHSQQQQLQYCISSIQEALKAVMEKSTVGDESAASGSVKRQRTNIISIS